MSVKGNQESLRFAIADHLRNASNNNTTTISTENIGHGRIERRTLVVLALQKGDDLGWPGACQIGSIKRVRINPRTGEILSRETTYFGNDLLYNQSLPCSSFSCRPLADRTRPLGDRKQGSLRS